MRRFEMSEAVEVGSKERVGRVVLRGRTQWSLESGCKLYFTLRCALFLSRWILGGAFGRLYTTVWWRQMVEYRPSTFHNDCLKFAGRQKSLSNCRKGVWCKRKWSSPPASGEGGVQEDDLLGREFFVSQSCLLPGEGSTAVSRRKETLARGQNMGVVTEWLRSEGWTSFVLILLIGSQWAQRCWPSHGCLYIYILKTWRDPK